MYIRCDLSDMDNKSVKLGKFIIVIALLLFGGFYDWNIALIGCMVCLYAITIYCRRRNVYKKEYKFPFCIPEIIIIFQILVSFWSIDRSANLSGIIRGIVILLWMNICFQNDNHDKEKLLLMIPNMGEYMVICGCLAFFFERLKSFFWRAGRFGGFFQYANTCALFLLLGVVVCCFEWEKEEKPGVKVCIYRAVKMIILVLGILLTGSRSVLMIFMFWGILHSVRNKIFRRNFISITVSAGIALGGYYLLTGDGTQNISRIFTVIRSNSTLWGRLLYDIDGISILTKHPMGLGYLGYYYVQHMLQTGIYTVRFVHNDILQIGLDYGIIPMFLCVFYIGWQLIKGTQSRCKKEILSLILAASLLDFHMQFIVIDFIVVLCVDLGNPVMRQKKQERMENSIMSGICMFAFTFCFISYLAAYMGKYEIALQFMPNNTEVLREVMSEADDKDTASYYADRILHNNKYISEAYNVKVYVAAMKNDLDLLIKNQDEVLKLEKYDIEQYHSYDLLLNHLELQNMEGGKYENVEKIKQKRLDNKKRLDSLRETTNPIAYKLRDIPQYTW